MLRKAQSFDTFYPFPSQHPTLYNIILLFINLLDPRFCLLNPILIEPIERQVIQVRLSISIFLYTCVFMLVFNVFDIFPDELFNFGLLGFDFVFGYFSTKKDDKAWGNDFVVDTEGALPCHDAVVCEDLGGLDFKADLFERFSQSALYDSLSLFEMPTRQHPCTWKRVQSQLSPCDQHMPILFPYK